MIATSPAEAKIVDTLASIENALISPLVGGEIGNWTKNVQEQAATLSVDFASFLRTVLHPQNAEIARSSPQFTKELEKLTVNESQIQQDIAGFLEQLHRFSKAVENSDPQKRETAFETQRQKVVDAGVALVLAIRKHQAASSTW